MSTHAAPPPPAPDTRLSTARTITLGLAAAAVGAIGVAVGFALAPRTMAFGYLAAYAAVASAGVGAIFLLAIAHVTDAGWLVALRRPIEAVAAAVPLLIPLFIPIALSMGLLYPWTHPHGLEPHVEHAVEAKRAWLDAPFFLGRSAAYLVVWTLFAGYFVGASLRGDRRETPPRLDRQRAAGAIALPVVGVAATLAAFDWLMSLEPAWFSSVFGAYVLASGFTAAIALALLLAVRWERAGRFPPTIGTGHFHALAKLFFTGVVLWAYLFYFQGMLIWIGNRPEETSWYAQRALGPWSWVFVTIVLARFVIPFFALLPWGTKRDHRTIAIVAALLLAAHALEAWWLVDPARAPAGPGFPWAAIVSLAALGGAAAAFSAFLLRGAVSVPERDPRLLHGLRCETT